MAAASTARGATRKRHDRDRTQRIPRATGGIEKNQEITIGCAMKKRGMAWSARGANHLAKLVIAWQDNTTWNSLWKELFPPLTLHYPLCLACCRWRMNMIT